MSESMIERCVVAGRVADWHFAVWHPELQREFVVAIIEAMREPTKEMVSAGCGVWPGHPLWDVTADDWRKMIDEALK